MEPGQIAKFKQQLLAQRDDLLTQLATLRGGNISRVEASAAHFGNREPDSRAQVETERELEFALDARESAELEVVDTALHRIDAGDYGICTDCGIDIPIARLQAAPETPLCVNCQTKLESLHQT